MKEISKIQILDLSRLLKDKKIKINIDKSAEELDYKRGFFCNLRSKTVKRVIQNLYRRQNCINDYK